VSLKSEDQPATWRLVGNPSFIGKGRVARHSGTTPRRTLVSCEAGYFSVEIERDQLRGLLQFFVGETRRFRSSNQFNTTLICRKVAASSLLIIKNRRLSGETSKAGS
jgi:hypothetical protein